MGRDVENFGVMNFFQTQNKLFFSKKNDAGVLDLEGEQSFVPFLFNRWLSFYGKDTVNFTNETLNKFHSLFESKQEMYKLYYYLIPRLKFKRIQYIKKKKEVVNEETDNLALIASNNQISVRELQQYLNDLT